jgi:hypothetical protein
MHIANFQRSCALELRFDAILPPGEPWAEFEEFWDMYAKWMRGEIEFDQLWTMIHAVGEELGDRWKRE